MYKQDLAMAYFPHCSNVAQSECRGGLPTLPNQSNVIEDKKTASRLLAREINNSQEREQSERVHFCQAVEMSAMQTSPHDSSFVHRFAIETSTGCFFSLRPTGYRPPQKRLSPRQLQILFSFLGEP
ncbi:MAG: hypothetical protein IKK04_03895 [Bacteroidales bacterium]|nr:hypothetical protein [Bacteroidales bacterium]